MASRRVARDLGVGVGVGAFSGAFGVGGGILLVPYLAIRRGVPQKIAQATSLVLVSMAAAAGAATYALRGSVEWLPAAFVLAGGLAGAVVGAALVQRIHDRRLRALFGVILILAAVRLLWPTGAPSTSDVPTLTVTGALLYLAAGLGMGVLSALFGIGGGILLVPILVAGFGYGQQLASGTSLVVMAPIALVGAIRLTRPGLTRWGEGARFGAGAIVGAVIGAVAALAVSGRVLTIAFAALLVVVGITMIRSGIRGEPSRPPDDV